VIRFFQQIQQLRLHVRICRSCIPVHTLLPAMASMAIRRRQHPAGEAASVAPLTLSVTPLISQEPHHEIVTQTRPLAAKRAEKAD
jgi:hypothetical protein